MKEYLLKETKTLDTYDSKEEAEGEANTLQMMCPENDYSVVEQEVEE